MNNNVQDYITVAKGISDFGVLIIIAAIFLVTSGSLMIACFKWFKHIINKTILETNSVLKNLTEESKKQTTLVKNLVYILEPETTLKVRNITEAYFDLALEQVCNLVPQIIRENHLNNKEAITSKLKNILTNLHDERDTYLAIFTYKGKPLSSYTSSIWIEWVLEAVLREIYTPEGRTPERIRTNLKTVYSRIKINFYNNISE